MVANAVSPCFGTMAATLPLRSAEVTNDFAFDRVYSQHSAFVWRVLRGMGLQPGHVEDAVQDTFMVVHRRLPEFDGRHAIRTWLFEIAYRVACEYRRKLRRTGGLEPLDDALRDRAPRPDESAERAQGLRVLGELLERLDEHKRITLVLAEIEEMTAPEIAAMTGVPLNTVYTRLRRARIELSEALAARKKKAP